VSPGHAFHGTTNLDVTRLTELLQSRFQPVRLQPPDNEILAAFLARRWGAPIGITRQIAEGAKGNVRAALADLGMWMGEEAPNEPGWNRFVISPRFSLDTPRMVPPTLRTTSRS